MKCLEEVGFGRRTLQDRAHYARRDLYPLLSSDRESERQAEVIELLKFSSLSPETLDKMEDGFDNQSHGVLNKNQSLGMMIEILDN